MKQDNNDKRSGRNWGRTLLIALALIILYAYATQVLQINLEEPLEPRRQQNLVSLIRELARPDLFRFDSETRSTNASIRMPCPEEIRGSQVSNEGRLVLMIPNCATTTQDPVEMQGTGFAPNTDVAIRWYPAGSTTTRGLTTLKTNAAGEFAITFTMPDIRPTEEPQRIEIVEVIDRQIVGLSDTTILALEKIVETVLMALMASTIGTLLAIPISFMAAQNLMRDVRLPLAAVMAAIALVPLGGGLGWWGAQQIVSLSGTVSSNGIMGLGALVVMIGFTGAALRFNPALEEEEASPRSALIWLVVTVILILLDLMLLAQLGLRSGIWLEARLELFSFVGNFIFVLSDLALLLLPSLLGFIGILLAISLGGRYGQEAVIRLSEQPARIFTALLTVAGTAVFVLGLGFALIWIDFFGIGAYAPDATAGIFQMLLLPSLIIGAVAGILSLLQAPKRPFPIGLATYTVTRGSLNTLRSIEPIMMGFVFVVWVGLGPFAGILALTLHSIADLGKLFSEEVENIDEGPREAITATGANAVQSIVYSVVPQITPHYIAYIFYRWDINVRMSTIIGFVGGGGIGFVLQRFLNQLQYNRASVMVIAIALVVTVLDNISSRIRTRII